jgi:hypothetical protein
MRRRTRKIRRSVAGLTLGLFTAAFLAVYVQLASGHDPALTANAGRRNVTTSLVASTSSTTAANAKQEAATASTETGEASTESSGTSAVTTSQS